MQPASSVKGVRISSTRAISPRTASRLLPEPRRQDFDNLLAVEPTVLDENRPGLTSCHSPTRNEDAPYVGFECLPVEGRRERHRVALDARGLDKRHVRMVPRQQKDRL